MRALWRRFIAWLVALWRKPAPPALEPPAPREQEHRWEKTAWLGIEKCALTGQFRRTSGTAGDFAERRLVAPASAGGPRIYLGGHRPKPTAPRHIDYEYDRQFNQPDPRSDRLRLARLAEHCALHHAEGCDCPDTYRLLLLEAGLEEG